jgi:signal transduction histidine kinase/ActR/RegA family two-component response regulator
MEQMVGQLFQLFVPAAHREAFQTMFLKGLVAAIAGELALQRPDGKEVPVHLALSPVPAEEDNTLCLVVTDLSEYKHRQLEEINAALEQRVAERTALAEHRAVLLQKLAGQLSRTEERERQRLGRIVHDHIQQLLVGAKFNTNVLGNQMDEAARRESLRQVDQLLDESLAACRSLTEELSPPVLYHGTLGQALQWLGQWMQKKHGLSVHLELDGQANPPSEEIRVLLFQAVRELLLNVIRHANVRQVSVTVSRPDTTYVQAEVADSGAGFDPQAAPVQQAVDAGLGLFRVRERLELLGGRMGIDSAPGRGTRITLVAPMELFTDGSTAIATQAQTAASPATPHAVAPAGSDAAGRKIRVLLADDHAVVRDGLGKLLQLQASIEVIGRASDGQQALDMALQLQPDVVVMDVSMPKLNGMEATRQILARLPATHIIGLSMHTEPDIATAMRDAGACAYLTKTSPPEVLVAAIRECPCKPAARPNS